MKRFVLFFLVIFALFAIGCEDLTAPSADAKKEGTGLRRGCITEFAKDGNILVVTAVYPAPIDLKNIKSVEVELYVPDVETPSVKTLPYQTPNAKGEWVYNLEFTQQVRFVQLFLVE